MLTIIKRIFHKLIVQFKGWVNWSRKTPLNFAKFIILWSFVALGVRYTLLMCFSSIPPIFNKLLVIASLSSIISIVIFYIKFYYGDSIKSTLKPILLPVVNIDRISSNMNKITYLQEVAQKENPDLKFWVIYLQLPIMLIFCYLTSTKMVIPGGLLLVFACLLLFYISYLMRLRYALMHANIPLDKIPVPSKLTAKRWYLTYTVKAKINLFLRGPIIGGGTVQKATEYICSPEFQKKAKVMTTTFALASMIAGTYFSAEHGICHLLGRNTPSYVLLSKTVYGYFTPYPETRERLYEIRRYIREDQIKTFIIPGTGELDDKAIDKAYLRYKTWEEGYSVTGSEAPDLVGPHIHSVQVINPIDTKESGTESLLSFE